MIRFVAALMLLWILFRVDMYIRKTPDPVIVARLYAPDKRQVWNITCCGPQRLKVDHTFYSLGAIEVEPGYEVAFNDRSDCSVCVFVSSSTNYRECV